MKSARKPLCAGRGLFALWLALAPWTVAAQDTDLRFSQISTRTGVVDIANAGDGSGRLFLVQQAGRIWINKDGEDLGTPFLSITDRVETSGNEQGLLSVAFPPDYESSGHFYIWYTAPGGGMVLSRFKVSNDDPDVADPDSETLVLSVAQPFDNHNGGRLQFGPDGMLYLGLGDGGGAFDPQDNAQNGGTLLGKLIRLDVDPSQGSYAVPQDNPFVGSASIRDEIWALGLRNPWRISFDSGTGDLYIADVGQNQLEEVNHQPAASGGGENYGWDIMEASQCASGGDSCNTAGFTLPVAEYDHDSGCSITGGEVYRGNDYPGLFGTYLFGDYCSGNVWGLRREGSQWDMSLLAETGFTLSTFGRGEDGEIYAASQFSGVFLISDGEPASNDFVINSGLSDAWYDPATDGQGFFIVVWPDTGLIFLSWFTFDMERPPQDATAMLGEPGHRWLTAQGPYSGDTANLEIAMTAGGVFDSSVPAPDDPLPYGTISITWSDCGNALLTYNLTSSARIGQIPLQRIVDDNLAACEANETP
jgi:glucose/arabinose dehydrogenase